MIISELDKKHHHPLPHDHSEYPSTVLWIVFIIMAASAIGFAIMGAIKPMKLRAHSFLSTAICTIAAASYYALATESGKVPILAGSGDTKAYRNIFYARYIDWVFTTPLLLLSVLLISGIQFGHVLWILFFDVLMIVLGLIGALTIGHSKWGWFVIAAFFQVLITYGLLVPGTQAARARNAGFVRPYLSYAIFLALVWIGYPIVWALADGTNLISGRDEAGAYALLDLIAKPIFGWIVMLGLGPIHNLQLEEERMSPATAHPLSTPIGQIWGTPGTATAAAGDTEEYAPLTGGAEA